MPNVLNMVAYYSAQPGRVAIADLSTREMLANEVTTSTPYPAAMFLDANTLLVIDTANERAYTFDVASGIRTEDSLSTLLQTLVARSMQPGFSVNQDGSLIAIPGSASGHGVTVIQMPERTLLTPFLSGSPTTQSYCAFSPDGSRLAVTSQAAGTRLVVFNTSTWAVVASLAMDAGCRQCAWSPDGTRLAVTQNVVNGPNALAILEASGWTRVSGPSLLPGTSPAAGALCYSPDGGEIAIYQTSGSNSVAYILSTTDWSVVAGPMLVKIGSGDAGSAVNAIKYHPNGSDLFVSDKVFRVSDGVDITDYDPVLVDADFLTILNLPLTLPFWSRFRNAHEII